MALEPDLFGTGVAISTVAEWTGYDTAYTERYLALPDDNPDGYRESSAQSHVAEVRGAGLMVGVQLREQDFQVSVTHAITRGGKTVALTVAQPRRTAPANALASNAALYNVRGQQGGFAS